MFVYVFRLVSLPFSIQLRYIFYYAVATAHPGSLNAHLMCEGALTASHLPQSNSEQMGLLYLFIARHQRRKRNWMQCGMRERLRKGVRQRQSEAGGMPEDYQADLQQICPPRQMDQRLDQDQWSA